MKKIPRELAIQRGKARRARREQLRKANVTDLNAYKKLKLIRKMLESEDPNDIIVIVD